MPAEGVAGVAGLGDRCCMVRGDGEDGGRLGDVIRGDGSEEDELGGLGGGMGCCSC